MDAKDIADEARASISDYCINTCGALCCRKGILILRSEREADLVVERREEWQELQFLERTPRGQWALHVGRKPCPKLKDNLCTVYEDRDRPKACGEFPLYLWGKTVAASPMCPAVNEGRLDPYLERLKKEGCRIIEP